MSTALFKAAPDRFFSVIYKTEIWQAFDFCFLGTKLYVEGYGYAIAADTGGAIKGNRVDLFFNTEAEASNWGVRNLDVYILN